MTEYKRVERHEINLVDVITELRKRVAEAEKEDWIVRPISYVMYHLWREIDLTEANKERK